MVWRSQSYQCFFVFTLPHISHATKPYTAINDAVESGRFELENSTNPAKPFVTESMEADLYDSFETIKILLSTLGYPVFDKISRETSSPRELFVLNNRDIHAEGNLVDDGFVVFSGSEARIETMPSCHRYLLTMRNKLIESQILVPKENKYVFQQNYIFNSPSTAGGVIIGRSTNGWTQWKNTSGITLDEIKRK